MALIWDYENQFSDKQALTATAVSTNIVKVASPWTAGNPDAPARTETGSAEPVTVQVFGSGFTGTGSVTVGIETADMEDFSDAVVIQTNSIPTARLKKGGALLAAYLPASGARAFLRLQYTVAGAIGGAGKVSAGLTLGSQTNV